MDRRRKERILETMAWKNLEMEGKIWGIIGAGRGCGATHLAVGLANWLTGVCREKTAVLEWNGHGDFRKMLHFCRGGDENREYGEILGVDYYPDAGAEELAFCINQPYRRILIDYGEYTEKRLMEWSRCDRKLLIGSFSEWQCREFLDLLKLLDDGNQKGASYTAVAAFGSEETRRSVRKEQHREIPRVPYSVDAYTVTRTDMNFYEKLCRDRF
jgi:hypothetical protein